MEPYQGSSGKVDKQHIAIFVDMYVNNFLWQDRCITVWQQN